MDSLYNWNDGTKIGVALTGLGIFFSGLGIVFFLDSALLTMGNLLFVAGVALVMGPARCKSFFLDRRRMRASICFFLGIFLVMLGWCFIGLIIQGFGGLNLFGNFFPMVVRVLESMPVIGNVMQLSAVQLLLEKLDLGRRRSV
ncbi:membrane-associated protein, putative [Bodo saltans]|uniref:Membrane-associated protein, putative n=1 Tax=Bodo saltans TaxID=75058 RepID=A0A0S4IR47_BODSA|nr:membrane-associated protein, putative [Bodo saltans]|eukprot:CUF39495.1 membrane-associated protein, putative [Bodo saltans]